MESKSFIYNWCNKKNLGPKYDYTHSGPPHCRTYKCDLSVEQYDYIATGVSQSKKGAEKEASRMYIKYLLTKQILLPKEVPPTLLSEEDSRDNFQHRGSLQSINEHRSSRDIPSFSPALSRSSSSTSSLTVNEQAQIPASVNDIDVENDGLTLENSKSRLNLFAQKNGITVTYIYNFSNDLSGGSYTADATIYLHFLNTSVIGHGVGNGKQLASKKCALSIMRQLYCLGAISRDQCEQTVCKTVNVNNKISESPERIKNVNSLLQLLTDSKMDTNSSQPVSLDFGKTSKKLHSMTVQGEECVQPNRSWNPWSSPTVNEKPLNAVDNSVLFSQIQTPTSSSHMRMSYLSSFQEDLAKKYTQVATSPPIDALTATDTTAYDISKIDFSVYKETYEKLGNYNEFDVFGYYISMILKSLPPNQASELKNGIIALVKSTNISPMEESTSVQVNAQPNVSKFPISSELENSQSEVSQLDESSSSSCLSSPFSAPSISAVDNEFLGDSKSNKKLKTSLNCSGSPNRSDVSKSTIAIGEIRKLKDNAKSTGRTSATRSDVQNLSISEFKKLKASLSGSEADDNDAISNAFVTFGKRLDEPSLIDLE